MHTAISSDNMRFPLLDRIQSPTDLRQLSAVELPQLACELRTFLIQTIQDCGGHFGANLGTVELTIALHYILNTPEDRIVWDVGHQAYPHKILTGRRHLLSTIRQTHGLAPFPDRAESMYDTFGVGHSSTSISAALGMALAAKQQKSKRLSVAVIGDGGLTGGMAFEALNHAGVLDVNLLVILNDNKMSISYNVGALTNHLARLLSSPPYMNWREGSKKMLAHLPTMHALAKRTETHVKGMLTPGTLFEELGFHYFGPIDGHDLPTLLPTLYNLSQLAGPRLLHVVTAKGKGHSLAEKDPILYHAIKPKPRDHQTSPTTTGYSYSEIFGTWVCEMAEQDERLVAITPAMCEGSGLTRFAQRFPTRYFDVGIAEQHSLTLAAGMACEGLKPVVVIYSTFLQRAYDQLIHDLALQNLDVTLAIDRGGLVGGDGATHQGNFDLSYLRCIPNVVIMAATDESECRHMLYTAYMHPGLASVRYPRGHGPGVTPTYPLQCIPIGTATIVRKGKYIAILVFGSLLNVALMVADQLNATVVNMRFIKPLDGNLLQVLATTHDLLVTVEENSIVGGAGSGVNEWLAVSHLATPILNLGLPDCFIAHGEVADLLSQYGLDTTGIQKSIKKKLEALNLKELLG